MAGGTGWETDGCVMETEAEDVEEVTVAEDNVGKFRIAEVFNTVLADETEEQDMVE